MYDISFDRSIDCLGPIMTLNKWRVVSNFNGEIDRAVRENKYYMFYTVNKRWPDKRDVITVLYDPICYFDSFYEFDSGLTLVPVSDWNTPPGFIHKGYFHFFDTNKIYIFNANQYYDSQIIINATLTTIHAKEFFICNQHEHYVPVSYPQITTPSEDGKHFFSKPLIENNENIFIFQWKK